MNKFDKYRDEIQKLIAEAVEFEVRVGYEINPKLYEKDFSPGEVEKFHHPITHYEVWYTKARAVVTQLLPGRIEDFTSYYRPLRTRKEVTAGTYTISDYLRGISVLVGGAYKSSELVYALIKNQGLIVKSLLDRLDSVLFDIRYIEHADLLDDELSAAEELNNKGFTRGAGALAGVALESHLGSVCSQRSIKLAKAHPTIATYNDALKDASAYDMATWRFIQHLADLRNNCDHKKSVDPTKEEVTDLIAGVRKIIKTVF